MTFPAALLVQRQPLELAADHLAARPQGEMTSLGSGNCPELVHV
jgi:hypothetical protein